MKITRIQQNEDSFFVFFTLVGFICENLDIGPLVVEKNDVKPTNFTNTIITIITYY